MRELLYKFNFTILFDGVMKSAMPYEPMPRYKISFVNCNYTLAFIKLACKWPVGTDIKFIASWWRKIIVLSNLKCSCVIQKILENTR